LRLPAEARRELTDAHVPYSGHAHGHEHRHR
jgi:hypothetical protein